MYGLTGKVIKADGKRLIIECDNDIDINKLFEMGDGKSINCDIKLHDNRLITPLQRNFIYAMFRDVANFTGETPQRIKEQLKADFAGSQNIKPFSLANCEQELATAFIHFIIAFIFEWGIEVKEGFEYMLHDNYYFYQCLLHRECCICGQEADIAHIETVGSGRDRRKIDHTKHHFMSLCRIHHTEQHTIGIQTFMNKYQIIPVRMTYEDVIKLNLASREQVESWKNEE